VEATEKKKKILDSISQYQECRAKPSRKNPASEKNLTFAVVGSKSQSNQSITMYYCC
jgi:hypothetical protein